MDVTRSRTQPNVFSRRLFAPLAGRYDRLAEILSMGQNRRWRTAMVEHITGSDARLVLDVACGPARVSRAIAEETSAHVIGLDLSESMLAQGKTNVAATALQDRISLVLGRGEQLPFPDATFDALTFTYLLRYVADPAATVAELGSRRQARWTDLQSRVRRSHGTVVANRVVVLHPDHPSDRRVRSPAAAPGSRSAASSVRASTPTTASTPSTGRSRPGRTPASTMSGPAG